MFGDQTRAAYRAEQLTQSFKGTDADGVPGPTCLAALGRLTGSPPRRRGRASHRPGGFARTRAQGLVRVLQMRQLRLEARRSR